MPQTVLVTGASRGLGLEFVRQYADAGDRVIAACRDPARAAELQALAARSGGHIATPIVDVASGASVAALRAAVGDAPIDVLIANAGVAGPQLQDGLGSLDFDGWLETLSVNTLGPVRVAEAFLSNLRAGRGKKLIAITSGLGSTRDSSGGRLAYRASKAALNNVWRGLSIGLRREGIVCVAMSPGWVRTDMGGPGGQLSPPQSVGAMRGLIEGFEANDSGRFVGLKGEDIAW